jgi:hypothetical protein
MQKTSARCSAMKSVTYKEQIQNLSLEKMMNIWYNKFKGKSVVILLLSTRFVARINGGYIYSVFQNNFFSLFCEQTFSKCIAQTVIDSESRWIYFLFERF